MWVDKDTTVCISLARTAGNFGTRVHNAMFQKLGLNFLYKSFSTDDIAQAIYGARAMGIRGISVTTPYKMEVLRLVDTVTPEAQFTGAANTVVNNGGVLVAYNTDTDSARILLEEQKNRSTLYILGNGGFSKAVQYSAAGLFDTIKIIERKNWDDFHNIREGVVFNCTPLQELCFPDAEISFIDCDIKSPTGRRLAVLQASRQFELYTGRKFLTDYVLGNLDEILVGKVP